ncbi:MAG: ribonuclease H-like domain-containing protein [candidate division Zixibacteria bacterium]|nr:ribonuclease H-like domain-containing protein [candidate division Zixibacteria bacterium]
MSSRNLHERLDRFQNQTARPGKSPPSAGVPQHYRGMALSLGGEIRSNFAGAYCLTRTVYPADYRYGRLRLGEVNRSTAWPLSAFTVFDEPGTVDLSSLLFLDTETTGLGGVGVMAFLVGCGSLVGDCFEVRQYLMPDYSDETAMLEDLQKEWGGDKTLVTYNGAAFDLPLLRGRLIVNRVARDITTAGHIDLLHAARRLFRRRLSDCTLTNVERELFSFHRDNDIPGYLIPSVYFGWLSDQNPDSMVGVMEHNRFDILSLYFLAGHLARIFLTDGEALGEAEDLHSLARVFGRRKNNEQVNKLYRRIEHLGNGSLPDDVVLYHSLAFKRVGDLTEAVGLWQELSKSSSKESYWANLELAKFFEHKARDFARAFHHAKLAERLSPYGRSHAPGLSRRLQRISSKLTRSQNIS